MESRLKSLLRHEVEEHSFFTLASVIIAIICVFGLRLFPSTLTQGHTIFAVSHQFHLIASSAAMTAVVFRNMNIKEMKQVIKVICAVLLITLSMCTVSDTLLPTILTTLLGYSAFTELHLEILHQPGLLVAMVAVGMILGVIISARTRYVSQFFHCWHVLLSSFASLYYVVLVTDIAQPIFWLTSFVVAISVAVPCLISDVILPLIFLQKNCIYKSSED